MGVENQSMWLRDCDKGGDERGCRVVYRMALWACALRCRPRSKYMNNGSDFGCSTERLDFRL